jgi:16S rRNA processing protein RimM|tara:strand:+ start:588 stop:1097 length:510 start_codon:yes stop_codon:yes gene_type:complete
LLDTEKILIAKIQAHQGLNGWLKIYSYSESKKKFSNYKHFFVIKNETYVRLDVEDSQVTKSIKIKFKNFSLREHSDEYIGKNLYIDRGQLVELDTNQYYWNDLIGLEVYLEEGEQIGFVKDIIETGSNDVLVIKGSKGEEILIPYVFGESIKKVILNEKKIIIDKIYYE